MFTLRRLFRQHALTSVWVLAFALLVSMGWGQVHRVLHPGVLTFTAADAGHEDVKAAVPGLGDEDGSSLCKLLDHLTHGAGPTLAVAVLLAGEPPALTPTTRVPGDHAAAARSFDARAPPRLT